jgi:hypothetical protein
MFAGIALAYSELPVALIEQHRVHDRGGEREVRFLLRDRRRVLPVWLDGKLQILRWGTRRGQSRSLPCTAWTWQKTLDEGSWNVLGAVQVVIPATMGLDRGIWFRIREGVHGVVARDEQGRRVVYVVCEPATHYYQVMTRSSWMPVLVGERI